MEQWYGPTVPSTVGELKTPGSRFPVSTDRSFNTTRCVTLSTLCHTTICPAGTVAGFGVNDCAPLIATTLIVTTLPLDGVGLPGLAFLLPLPPQPHIPRPSAPTASAAAQFFIASFLPFNDWS